MKIPKILLVVIIVLTSVGCDQTSKILASSMLQNTQPKSFLNGWIHLQYAENAGGFLSIGAELPAPVRVSIATAVAFFILLGLIVLLLYVHRLTIPSAIGYSLFLAGGCGNSIDRLLNEGRVTDFIIFGTNALHTGIFNLADVFIALGIVLAVAGNIRAQKNNF